MWPVAAGADHRDVDVAGAAAGDERLGAVQHIVVAVAARARRQRRRVGAAAGLGQAVAGEVLHAGQLWQKPRALVAIAKTVDHPRRHVVDREIGGGRDAGRGQFLEDDCGVDPAEPAAAELLADIDPGKPQRRRAPQRRDRKLLALVPARRLRQPLRARKRPRRLLKRPLLVRERKIHAPKYRGRRVSGNCSIRSPHRTRLSAGRRTLLTRWKILEML